MWNKISKMWNNTRIGKNISLVDRYSVNFWEAIWIIPTTLAPNLLVALISDTLTQLEHISLIVVIGFFLVGSFRMYKLNIILKGIVSHGDLSRDFKKDVENKSNDIKYSLVKSSRNIFWTGIVLPFLLLVVHIIFVIFNIII